MTALDQSVVDRIVRLIVERDRREPGTAREVVLAIVARLGTDVAKPKPQNGADVDLRSLIG